MNISVNTQNSIKIDNIYFDPLDIKDESHDAKIIFFTHSHYDHFSPNDFNKLKNDNTIFVMPSNMKSMALDNDIKEENIITMNPNTEINVLDLKVKAIPAYNINKQFHPKSNNWLGYIVNINDKDIYVVGDSDDISSYINVLCDILFVPIGGKFTMDYKEAANFTNNINPKIVIPTHYGSIIGTMNDFYSFKELINNNIEVLEKIK